MRLQAVLEGYEASLLIDIAERAASAADEKQLLLPEVEGTNYGAGGLLSLILLEGQDSPGRHQPE